MKTADLGNGILYEQDVLAIGTDSVLLASFAEKAKGPVCDLGCGAGAVMLLMALKGGGAQRYDGVEIRPEAAALARENIRRAGLSERMEVYPGDLREIGDILPHAAYGAVVSNPPYMPLGGSIPPEDAQARIARTEECCTLPDLCRSAAYLLKYGGGFFVVYPAERLSGLMRAMGQAGIEPKRLRLYCKARDARAALVLLEGRKGGREGMEILPSLYGDSEEFQRISKTF